MGNGFFFLLVLFGLLLFWRGKRAERNFFLFILSVASNPVTMHSPELTNNLC